MKARDEGALEGEEDEARGWAGSRARMLKESTLAKQRGGRRSRADRPSFGDCAVVRACS